MGDVAIMKSYAENHKAKFAEIDASMFDTISSNTQSPAHSKILKRWWLEDGIRNAQMSQQLWDKKESFLETQRTKDLQKSPADYLLKSKNILRKPRPPPRTDVKQRNRVQGTAT